MKAPLNHPRRKVCSGFTLIEVLVVIAIIAVLATLTIGGMSWFKRKENDNRTKILVSSLDRALEEYNIDNGGYPPGDGTDSSTTAVYEALYGDLDGDKEPDPGKTVYLPELDPNLQGVKNNVKEEAGNLVIIDAWKNPMFYESPGTMNPDFDIWSTGEDGEGGPNGTEKEQRDDFNNWK